MISRGHYYLLTVNYALGTTLFVTINVMIGEAGPDAWIMPLWAGLSVLLAALFWIAMLRTSPGRSPVEIAREAWGPAGVLVGILYLAVFCVTAAWSLRNLSDFMNMTIMPTVVQEVELGKVLVNIHSVLTVIMITLIFIKLLVLLYAAFETIGQLFRPSTRWPHLMALGILISAGAVTIYENPIQNRILNDRYTLPYDCVYAVLIPVLLIITMPIKRAAAGRTRRG